MHKEGMLYKEKKSWSILHAQASVSYNLNALGILWDWFWTRV